jgi:hypothetical protein
MIPTSLRARELDIEMAPLTTCLRHSFHYAVHTPVDEETASSPLAIEDEGGCSIDQLCAGGLIDERALAEAIARFESPERR